MDGRKTIRPSRQFAPGDNGPPDRPQNSYWPPPTSSSSVGSLRTHVRILAVINIAFGALFVVLATIVFFVMPDIGMASQDPEAVRVLSVIGTISAGILLVLGLPGLVVGIGLWGFEPWSRIGAMVLGAINLMNIPFGTILSIYTFWVLIREDSSQLFRDEI